MSSQIPLNRLPIKHLRDYYSPLPQLFQDATHLPQFFQTNLVDDSRVVKYFPQDPQANLTIFYYQYLKLCFQIDNVDYESYIQKIYELIRTEGFQFYFDPTDQQKQYKNAQFKSLLIDFFEIMNSSSLTIDQVLIQYPVLDQVFINFFRSVLMIASVTNQFDSYIDKNQLFDFLSSFFSVDISSYDKCLKFVESDIFVYEDDPKNIYMAYIKDDEQDGGKHDDSEINKQDNIKEDIASKSHPQKFAMDSKGFTISKDSSQNTIFDENREPIAPSSQFAPNQSKQRAKVMIKESYIEGEFADYTSYHKKQISAFAKNLPSDSEKQFPQTAQNNGTYVEHGYTETNLQEISEIQHNKEVQKERKRIMSVETQSRFEIDPAYDQQEFSQRLTSHTRVKPVNKPLSTQDHQKLIESVYEKTQSVIAKPESKQKFEQQDLSNSKDFSKKQIAFNRNLYQHRQEPTKDPGFGSHIRPAQSTIYNSQLKPSSSHKGQQKPLSSQEPLFHKPSIPVPTLMHQATLSQTSRMVSSSKLMKDYQSPGTANAPTLASVRQNFKLNVTKQFTNSFVMKSMNEPFKTNVYKMRERAREFRKNLYQEFNSQFGNTTSLAEQKNVRSPSSRTNFPSSSTVQKPFSSNNLAIESNVKVESQSIKQIGNEQRKRLEAKNVPELSSSLLAKKLFDVREYTPSVSEQSSKTQLRHPREAQNVGREPGQQGQHQNIIGPVIGLGPSIVLNKQNQYSANSQVQQQNQHHPLVNSQAKQQNQPYPGNSQAQQPPAYHGSVSSQYQMSQHNLMKGQNSNTYQMGKPQKSPSSNYGNVFPSPTMYYANTLQQTEPTKLLKEQQVHREQQNNLVYGQASKAPTIMNAPETIYNQPVKRPVPTFMNYQRRT